MHIKLLCVFVVAAIVNLQVYGQSSDEDPRSQDKGAFDSLNNLRKQVQDLLTNVNTLLRTEAAVNAINKLNIAGTNISKITAASNQSVNQAVASLNSTLASIYAQIAKAQENATDQGVDTSNCTKNVQSDIAKLSAGYVIGLVDCPINLAAKGIAMINSNVQYANYISNLITTLPTNVSACNLNPSCLGPLVVTYAPVIVNAPLNLTSMVTSMATYVSTLQTNIGLCLTTTSVSTVAQATTWAANITLCIGKETANNVRNKNKSWV